VAAAEPGAFIAVREISAALGIPYPFLAKIVQTLTGAGLFRSMRGPTGGVTLARPARRITLKDIVLAVDGPAVFRACVLGLPGCGDRKPCPLHDAWAPARARIERMFAEATLADTAARIQAGDFRLAALVPA
jgi:Rrf2 family protein